MTDLAQTIALLSPEKRLLLDRLLHRQGIDVARAVILPRARPAQGCPLSFAQQRLWFLHQLDRESAAYNIPFAVQMEGPLHVAALAVSLGEIVRRHEVLRTTFLPVEGGEPAQVIGPAGPFSLAVVDLCGLSRLQRLPEARRLARSEAARPFDLARGPLLRGSLVALQEQEHLLLLTVHHIVSDGWSTGILVRELGALYRASSQGHPSPLPELPIQYADFALWQRRRLSGELLEAELAYWRERLRGLPMESVLPADRPRPAVRSSRGATCPLLLPEEISAGLQALCRSTGTTLFMILLAVFKVLLARYSGQPDLCIGMPVAGRTHRQLEDLIGFFANTLVLRSDPGRESSFMDFLNRVQEVTLAAYAHQELPFEKLVEDLQPQRDLSRTPLFQVMFVLQNTPMEPLEVSGLGLRPFPTEGGGSLFDLSLKMSEAGRVLSGVAEYNRDLFDAATARRLLGHFESLLGHVVTNPHQRLSALPLLTDPERHQLLMEWNDTARHCRAEMCLHHSIEAQMEKAPETVAVVFEGQSLTYAELNTRANRLARRLRALGVGPEMPVGLCVERSLDTIVGLLGILKASGAYVPLDPAYPPDRLHDTLEDALRGSRAPVLVTQDHLVGHFGDGLPFSIVRLDTDRELLAAESPENLQDGPAPDNLAYVIYTSGSTGRPKGVKVPHGHVVRLLTATEPWYGFSTHDVWTLFHSYSFDFSVWEIWGALAYGGRLVIVPREVTLSPADFHELLVTEGVTVLNQTPTAFRQLVQYEQTGPHRRLALRWVIFGGEALELSALVPWFARHGDESPRLVNMYGITETTVHVTWRPVGERDLSTGTAPIGEPIPDLAVHLLGPDGELVPIGVPAEIHVGGAGVARGYLGRPALTAERFVPDPFAGKPGARLYRSGDLARWRPDGDLEYLGRIDHQVKIRGFRIELGEIEATLSAHPAVRAAVALARTAGEGDKRLVAYIVPNLEARPSVRELRDHLRARLPEHMVPGAFVFLEALPVTANGKLNRKALPAPQAAAPGAEEGCAGPRTAVEELLAGIWSQVLQIDQVGLEDNFFDAGGHSLLATQLVSRVREVCGVELPVRAVFELPTVAGLAGGIEEAMRAGERRQALPLERISRDVEPPLSFAQERLWFVHQLEPANAAYNMPLAVRLEGKLDVVALGTALSELVRRHEALQSTFPSHAGAPVLRILPHMPVPLPAVDLAGLSEPTMSQEARRLAREEALRPCDLARGPLLRATLLAFGEEDHVLLLTIHHIVSDAWSMQVLVRELIALYEASSQSQPSPLPELPIQYADFAHWQRRRLTGEVLERHLGYWKRHLGGGLPILRLPYDFQPPTVRNHRGRQLQFVLSPELSRELRGLARREDATLFMTLLAAFDVLLARHTGQEDIVVGADISGRNRPEVEGLIGFFINMLVLRTDLSGDPSFRAVLARVREVALGGFAYQDLPYERLVEELRPTRSSGAASLFQVVFNFENVPSAAAAVPGLQRSGLAVSQYRAGPELVRFDFLLAMAEQGDVVSGAWTYSTELFRPATIELFHRRFETLLKDIVARPGAALSELEIQDRAERAQRMAEEHAHRQAKRDRFLAVKPKVIQA